MGTLRSAECPRNIERITSSKFFSLGMVYSKPLGGKSRIVKLVREMKKKLVLLPEPYCIYLLRIHYKKRSEKDLFNDDYAIFSVFLYKGICCGYSFELHRLVNAIQMSTHKSLLDRATNCYIISIGIAVSAKNCLIGQKAAG